MPEAGLKKVDGVAGADGGALRLHCGYLPGLIGRLSEMHARYYAEHWQFGSFFEARVATELSAFIGRYNPRRDAVWTLLDGSRIEAGLAIDGAAGGGQGPSALVYR